MNLELPPENIYGHSKRLDWIVSNLNKADHILELGCGTGYMITFPLSKMGYHAKAIDLDHESIEYGKKIFKSHNLDPNILEEIDMKNIPSHFNAIICSEVFEHIHTKELINILALIKEKLNSNGKILITIPNGYGWFELESFLWNKVKIGNLFQTFKILSIIQKIKTFLIGKGFDYEYPSTLSSSPHVQRFTYLSIKKLLEENGFEMKLFSGSVLFAGPFSNLLFTGFKPIMRLNNWLGKHLPYIASGFYIIAVPKKV